MKEYYMSSLIETEPLNEDNSINIFVETPRGRKSKFIYDSDKNCFFLKKFLPEGMVFPYDFGFIPRTLAGDGDPADVLIFSDEPLFPGCLLKAKLIGIIEAYQRNKKESKNTFNPRFIAVSTETHIYSEFKTIHDLDKQLLFEIQKFFKNYCELEGKTFSVKRISGPEPALKHLKRFMKSFKQK